MSAISQDRRPENASEMHETCPVCLEALFDEKGLAQNGEVAKIVCKHLVHSECLKEAGKSLNADGQRYGVGLLGARAGCPLCSQPVSFWESFDQAAAFPIFWERRIQNVLEEVGPSRVFGFVSVRRIRRKLKSDPQLTKEQKKYLFTKEHGVGFLQALKDGAGGVVTETRDDCISMYYKEGIWQFDKDYMTLWLYKWGPVPSRFPRVLSIATGIALIATVAGFWYRQETESVGLSE